MKAALSLLTAYIFLQTQSWALSGGPVFPTGAPNLAGIYSGVMAQRAIKFGTEFEEPNTGVQPNKDEPAGGIGVFTITVPTDGLSSGTAVLFVNGTLYASIDITGVADPDKTRFDGVLSGTQQFLDNTGATIDVVVYGEMHVKIDEKQGKPQPGRTDTAVGIAARLKGEAILDAFITTDINLTPSPLLQAEYSVSGFRSSTEPLP